MAEPLIRTPTPEKPLGVITPYEKPDLTVCGGQVPGKACGVQALYRRFKQEADRLQIPLRMEPAKIGCSGACARGPFVSLPRLGLFYQQVQEDHVPFILQETRQDILKQDRPFSRKNYTSIFSPVACLK